MTTDREIREWARAQGIDVPARGKLGQELRDRFDRERDGGPTADNPGLSAVGDTGPAEGDGPEEMAPARPAAVDSFDNGERPPLAPPGRMSLKRITTARPRQQHRRVSLEDLAADGWSAMAAVLGSQGLGPTARVLQMQAPVAGAILEDALRGTVVDRLLQPLARGSEKGREVAALVGPPLIVSVLTVKPELAPKLLPVLKRQMRTWVLIAGPKMKAREKAEQKAMAAMGMDDPGQLDGEVDAMIASLFAPPDMMMAPAEMQHAA